MSGRPLPSKRLYYSSEQIEQFCISELSAVGLLPDEPEAIRIDRFLEKRFGITHEYDDLPQEVLGYTRFGKSGPEAVVISRCLDDEADQASQRRARATLAHEAGHIILHTNLFTPAQDVQLTLFQDDGPKLTETVCRGDLEIMLSRGTYKGEWWEYQANMVIGSLLMPCSLVAQALRRFIAPRGNLGITSLDASTRESACSALAEIFDVNPVVVRIRVNQLHPSDDQLAI